MTTLVRAIDQDPLTPNLLQRLPSTFTPWTAIPISEKANTTPSGRGYSNPLTDNLYVWRPKTVTCEETTRCRSQLAAR